MSRLDPKHLPDVFWVSRDRLFGELVDHVNVWSVEPVYKRLADGDIVWVARDESSDWNECLGEWSVAEARLEIGNAVPDDAMQVVRKGEPAKTIERAVS